MSIAIQGAIKECPKCENHSVFATDKYKGLGLIYSHTEYKCEMGQGYCDYFQGKTIDVIRAEKLKKLGI